MPLKISLKQSIVLLGLGIAGAFIILFSTGPYGIGLSADSVEYISTARNISAGKGIVTYEGSYSILHPPLYALLLSLPALFNADPLASAPILNAIIFILIVYFAGILFFRHLHSNSFALAGIAIILFSRAFRMIFLMAWSEAPFLLLTVLFLLSIEKFIKRNTIVSLISASLFAGLASLTRYAGVTLIICGTFSVLLFYRNSFKKRIYYATIFGSVSSLFYAFWVIKNYFISGRFQVTGGESLFTLAMEAKATFATITNWYIHPYIYKNIFLLLPVLIIFCASVITCLLLAFKKDANVFKAKLLETGPVIIFTVTYLCFMIISSVLTNVSILDDRYLSPVFIPITLLLLMFLEVLLLFIKKRTSVSPRSAKLLLSILLLIYLIYPVKWTLADIKDWRSGSIGVYNTKTWRNSMTINYLQNHKLENKYAVYSNAPDAIYILSGTNSRLSPSMLYSFEMTDSVKRSEKTSDLKGKWPGEDSSYLVWMDKQNWRSYLFTVEELRTICDLQMIEKFDDGAIYIVHKN